MPKVDFISDDLSPGDRASASFDWSGFEIEKVASALDPLFVPAYDRLWKEFGAKGELETRDVLAMRLDWSSQREGMAYEIVVVRREGKIIAVRDHTAILRIGNGAAQAIVHLSHVWIAPEHRGTGLAGWLRARPVRFARECLKIGGLPSATTPVILVCEMEPPREEQPDTIARLRSYENGGFLMIDPDKVDYRQPDFRSPEQIDKAGGPRFLALRLLVRRVGREKEKEMRAAELKLIVSELYRMYEQGQRKDHMAPLLAHLERGYPPDLAKIKLVPPLKGGNG